MPGKVNKGSVAYIRRASEARAAMLQMSKTLNSELQRVTEMTEDALRALATKIAERSDFLVPVDTGALKASRFIQEEERPGGLKILVGYDTNAAPHAVFVHEILEGQWGEGHPHHAPPTQAKFLQTATLEMKGKVAEFVRNFVKGKTGA